MSDDAKPAESPGESGESPAGAGTANDESGDGGRNAGEAARAAAARGEAERRRITGTAGIVAAGTLTSRLLGLVRDQTLAAVFTRAATDVFFVAFVIPNVLRQLLAEGATQTAVLPVLTRTKEQDGEAATRRLYRSLRGLSIVVLALVTVAGVVLAPWLVELFATGYHDYGDQFTRTVELTRWVFPYIFFMGTFALGVAALNTYRRFVVTSFAPALLNVAFIVASLTLPAVMIARGEDPVMALAVAVLVGGLLQVAAQWPSLRQLGLLELPSFRFGHPGVREVLRRMGPVLLGTGVYWVDVLLARRFLSEVGLGAQSWFAWALRLCDFPQGIFVMALQTAALPSLATLAARGDRAELAKTFAYGMRLALFVGVGATVLVVALAEPLVVTIFQRGQFDEVSSRETARALMAQGIGIWAVAAVRQLVAAYYAIGDTRTPVIVAAIDLCVFVGLALGLRPVLGHIGISLAVSGASLVQMALLWVLLKSRLDRLHVGEVARSGGKTLAAAAAGAVVGVPAAMGVDAVMGSGLVARTLPGLVGAAVFGVVFLVAARLLASEELDAILAAVRRRRGAAR